MNDPMADKLMDLIKDKDVVATSPHAIHFHIGPLESTELAREKGYDFISYCGTLVVGDRNNGDWEQKATNSVCTDCLVGMMKSAMRGMARRAMSTGELPNLDF